MRFAERVKELLEPLLDKTDTRVANVEGQLATVQTHQQPLLEMANSRVATIQQEVGIVHDELEGIRSQWPDAELRGEVQQLRATVRGVRKLMLAGIAMGLIGLALAVAVVTRLM